MHLHLEYYVQAWRPYNERDADLVEGVQRRVTKMISTLACSTYEKRLRKTGLLSMKMRRLRSDLIDVHKIILYKAWRD